MSYKGFLGNRPPNWVGSVWKKYSYRIYKLCLQKCATKDEADDLFQEVALRFCRNAGELNNQIHLFAWLQTVLLHCHYNDYRKRHQIHEIPFSCLSEPKAAYEASGADACVAPDDDLGMEAVMGEFSLLLEALNPLEKMILELSVVGGLSLRDLSLLTGLSKGSVVHRRQVAIQKMQEKMAMQKDRIKMITGREASLREIIEYIG
ncbi:RNA polymerase sigma-70 factor, ECF subfamily [Fibrobacter sp. UWB11]|nr:RNA polymerase sigma-70 factor, ECF subfamily [Fibrobacter sp. UWB11]